MYEYKCQTVRVVDGSTIDAIIDLGFNVLIRQRIKLNGVNPPDIRSIDESQKNLALNAKARLTELVGKEFVCQTILNKRGKAGRTLGIVYVIDECENKIEVNQKLIDEGLATKFGV
jgi:micrococcal nuclease